MAKPGKLVRFERLEMLKHNIVVRKYSDHDEYFLTQLDETDPEKAIVKKSTARKCYSYFKEHILGR